MYKFEPFTNFKYVDNSILYKHIGEKNGDI